MMSVCDGCGAVAGDKHIRERIERLEWATRFRPVHIQVLLVDAAPPPRIEDYFYRAANDREVRSVKCRGYFDRLMKAAGTTTGPGVPEEAALGDFQRRGLFLTYVVECPVDAPDDLSNSVIRLFPTLLKRIQLSYRPKAVALLSDPSRELIQDFRAAGWGGCLVLDEGVPFLNEMSECSASQAGEQEDRLAAALNRVL
jgi:hypothetical protein